MLDVTRFYRNPSPFIQNALVVVEAAQAEGKPLGQDLQAVPAAGRVVCGDGEALHPLQHRNELAHKMREGRGLLHREHLSKDPEASLFGVRQEQRIDVTKET